MSVEGDEDSDHRNDSRTVGEHGRGEGMEVFRLIVEVPGLAGGFEVRIAGVGGNNADVTDAEILGGAATHVLEVIDCGVNNFFEVVSKRYGVLKGIEVLLWDEDTGRDAEAGSLRFAATGAGSLCAKDRLLKLNTEVGAILKTIGYDSVGDCESRS